MTKVEEWLIEERKAAPHMFAGRQPKQPAWQEGLQAFREEKYREWLGGPAHLQVQ